MCGSGCFANPRAVFILGHSARLVVPRVGITLDPRGLMLSRLRYTFAMLVGATLLAACADGDALTSPIGTTVASVYPAAAEGGQYLIVFAAAPPAGFAGWVAAQGGQLAWVHGRSRVALVAGLPDSAMAALLHARGIVEVRRVRIERE